MSPDTRRLMLFAGGVGGVLVCLIAASFLISHHGHEVPVIAADSRPIRVKPENPGGMQIDGAEHGFFYGGIDNSNAKLAPFAEVPDPNGIGDNSSAGGIKLPVAVTPSVDTVPRPEPAQVQSTQPQVAVTAPQSAAAVASPVARSPVSSTPLSPPAGKTAPSTVSSTGTGPSAVASASAPASPDAVPAPTASHAHTIPGGAMPAGATPAVATPVAHAVPAGHAMTVQLAALPSEPAAREEWQALARRMPDLLAGRQPSFSRVDRDGHVFWRVRTAGFADVAQARAFCDQIRAKGGACTVGDF